MTKIINKKHICRCSENAPCKKTGRCNCSTEYFLRKKVDKKLKKL